MLELKQRKQLLVEVLKVVFRLAHFAQDVQKFRARVLHCHAQDLVVYREVLEKLNLVASLVVDYKQPADTDFVRDVILVFRVELEVRIDHKLVRNYCCEVERRATLLKVERSCRAHHQRLLLQIEHAFKVHQEQNDVKRIEHRCVHKSRKALMNIQVEVVVTDLSASYEVPCKSLHLLQISSLAELEPNVYLVQLLDRSERQSVDMIVLHEEVSLLQLLHSLRIDFVHHRARDEHSSFSVHLLYLREVLAKVFLQQALGQLVVVYRKCSHYRVVRQIADEAPRSRHVFLRILRLASDPVQRAIPLQPLQTRELQAE